jgi:NMD protein affecting ribosome stability and mRNA decay
MKYDCYYCGDYVPYEDGGVCYRCWMSRSKELAKISEEIEQALNQKKDKQDEI